MTDIDPVVQSLDELRNSVARTTEVAQQDFHRKGGSYFRWAVAASFIVSALVSIVLVLVVTGLTGHVEEDQERFTQLQGASEKMSQDIQQLQSGAQGLRGEPPMSWIVTEADGSLTTCERAEGFDPAAPRYRCSHSAR